MISFIAAIALILVLSFFMISAIRNVKDELDEQMVSDMHKLSSVYYPLIDQKSEELKKLKEEIEILKQTQLPEDTLAKLQSEIPIAYHVFVQENAAYLDPQFFETYAFIQSEFQKLAKSAAKQKVEQLVHQRRSMDVHEFKEMLDLFDYSTQYEMYTLSDEEQQQIFQAISQNSMAKRRILDRYLKQHEHFDFKQFMDYVRDYIYRHDATVYIYSRDGEKDMGADEHYVVYCKDASIAEGYKIKYKDELYDYSLSGGRML